MALLAMQAFGHDPAFIGPDPAGGGADGDDWPDVNRGRGVFSRVVRVGLSWRRPISGDRPASVVMKLPASGPNGTAAMASGACRREAEAYRRLLPTSPVSAPRCHLAEERADGWAAFVLEDLTSLRAVDQLEGLPDADALAVAHTLARFHHHWSNRPELEALGIRRATPGGIPPTALEAGIGALRHRWAETVEPAHVAALERLVHRRDHLVDAFAAAGPPTLCHGDPRADNLVFDRAGAPILFDWQQIAVQFGPSDLAWLAATSLTPTTRRRLEPDLITTFGTTIDQYRLGLVLPGMAVLLLAQRETPDDRSERFVATTIVRIAVAVSDLEVPML